MYVKISSRLDDKPGIDFIYNVFGKFELFLTTAVEGLLENTAYAHRSFRKKLKRWASLRSNDGALPPKPALLSGQYLVAPQHGDTVRNRHLEPLALLPFHRASESTSAPADFGEHG
jgi:hypothetical protein